MPVYFISYTILFWLPSALFVFFILKLFDNSLKKSFWITTFIMAAVSVVMEFFYLKFDVWSFSQARDPLLGIWIWKAPVEEYVYWFGATPFCLGLYLSYVKIFERLKKRNQNA